MSRLVARRACVLVVVLALLVGTAPPGAGTNGGCAACPPGCPMHARRLGCHQTRQMACHRTPPSAGLRSACRHGDDLAPAGTSTLRGIIPVGVALDARRVARAVTPASRLLAARALPEPPTGPPRSSLA